MDLVIQGHFYSPGSVVGRGRPGTILNTVEKNYRSRFEFFCGGQIVKKNVASGAWLFFGYLCISLLVGIIFPKKMHGFLPEANLCAYLASPKRHILASAFYKYKNATETKQKPTFAFLDFTFVQNENSLYEIVMRYDCRQVVENTQYVFSFLFHHPILIEEK